MRRTSASVIRRPPIITSPSSGIVMRFIILMRVVLPAPLGPSSPNTRPGRTSTLTPSRAVCPAKRFTTPRASNVLSIFFIV